MPVLAFPEGGMIGQHKLDVYGTRLMWARVTSVERSGEQVPTSANDEQQDERSDQQVELKFAHSRSLPRMA